MTSMPAPRGRKAVKQGDERQRALLAALEKLLATRPIGELSVEGIAAGAGLSRSSFYFYFQSKHDALAAAVASVRQDMLLAAGPFFEGDGDMDPQGAIQDSLQGIARQWHRHRRLLAATVEATSQDAAVQTLWDEWIDEFVRLVALRIEAEQAAGRALPPPPDPAALATVLVWANERNLYRAHLERRVDLEGLVASLTALWVRTIYGASAAGA